MIEEKILEYFKTCQDGYVSGEELSRNLGVSRTAIWKHIERLRDSGYDILALPHLGYKLISTPDRLTEIELKLGLGTKFIGQTMYSYDEIGSTNDIAIKLAEAGAKEGVVVIADSQIKGRGRLGRNWASPKGKGIYLSLILRPELTPGEIPKITLMAAVSVAKAVRDSSGLFALIKWPNDILINGKKISGILTEMSGETDKVHFVIIGIGINVNSKKDKLPEGASSILEELGRNISRAELAKGLLKELEKNYLIFKEGKADFIIEKCREFSGILGKRVQASFKETVIEGCAVDIDTEGALIIRLDSGFNERVLAGDVVLIREG